MTERGSRPNVRMPFTDTQRQRLDDESRRQSAENSSQLSESITQKKPVSKRFRDEIDAAVSAIQEKLNNSDVKRRADIDDMVRGCFETARKLQARPTNQICFGGRWATYWLKRQDKPSASLRFIFKEVLKNDKRSSFYFRATRDLFENGVALDQITALVTEKGGYQNLADNNVKARPKTMDVSNETTSNKEKGDEQKRRADRRSFSEETITIRAIFEPGSSHFKDLPNPCRTHVDMEIREDHNGILLAHIFAAAIFEP